MTVTPHDICARMVLYLEDQLGRPVKRPVTADSHLVHDLQLDSMESVTMLAELEDHYGVTMPVQLFQRARTVGDVAQSVADVLSQSGGAPS